MLTFPLKLAMTRSSLFLLHRSLSTVEVTSQLVKELRSKTGAAMMDCKKALSSPDVNGDVSKAMDWLRAKGKARAASGANRVASEGSLALCSGPTGVITLLEVNSETDFVSRNADFQRFVSRVAIHVNGSFPPGEVAIQDILSSNMDDFTVQDTLADSINVIRENIVVRRATNIRPSASCIFSAYIHGKVGEVDVNGRAVQMGKSCAVVGVSVSPLQNAVVSVSEEVSSKLSPMVRRLAMHVVAASPKYLSKEDIPADVLARETDIIKEQMSLDPSNQGKAPAMLEKVLGGKLNKRLAEICLLGQAHVAEEGSPVVEKHVAKWGADAGVKISMDRFYHWVLGAE